MIEDNAKCISLVAQRRLYFEIFKPLRQRVHNYLVKIDFFPPQFLAHYGTLNRKKLLGFFCTFKNTAAEPLGQYKLGEDWNRKTVFWRLQILFICIYILHTCCYLYFVVAHVFSCCYLIDQSISLVL